MPFRVKGDEFALTGNRGEQIDPELDFEIEGRTSGEIRLTAAGRADPEGRYRVRVSDDSIKFQRAATEKWATATTLLELTKDEAIFGVPFNLDGVSGLVNAIADIVGLEVAQVVWLPGYGPSEPPEGYLAIHVGEHGDVRYIPYWQ